MIKKCQGCGVSLQTNDIDGIGYLKNENHKLCWRCFRIQHYNDCKIISIKGEESLKILKEINKTNDLVLLLIDIFNLSVNLEIIKKYLKNDFIIVITKYDLLKPYLKESKLKTYLKEMGINKDKIIIISSFKNYNLDELLTMINKNKKSKNVYVVGNTNVGKSTLINKLIYNYTNAKSRITTSQFPTTTLAKIEIEIDDNLTIIDTPGLIEEKSILDYVAIEKISNIIPATIIKPKTFQIKTPQTIVIDELIEIYFPSENRVTLYVSSKLKVKRKYKKEEVALLNNCFLEVPPYHDVVIRGLGFIKIIKATTIRIFYPGETDIYIRKSLI